MATICFFCQLLKGEYRVGVKFNDQHIPDSPFRVYITPAQGDAHKIEIGQFPDAGCQVNKPQAFIVRKNGATGDFDAKVCPIFIVTPLGGIIMVANMTFLVRLFLPRELRTTASSLPSTLISTQFGSSHVKMASITFTSSSTASISRAHLSYSKWVKAIPPILLL